MTVRFDLPVELEAILRESGQEPNSALKEAALVELYRIGSITHHQFSGALGLGRLAADEVLKRHDVPLDLSIDEFRAELASLTLSPQRPLGHGGIRE